MWLISGPLLAGSRQRAFPALAAPGTSARVEEEGRRGKKKKTSSLCSASVGICTGLRVCARRRARFRVCQSETLGQIERIERHLEEKREALGSVCILPRRHQHTARSQERTSLTLSLIIKLSEKCGALTKCHLFTGHTCLCGLVITLLEKITWRPMRINAPTNK